MPTISVDRADLFEALERDYTEQELDELCFDYGIELDEWDETGERPVVKIEIPANRYDMLCFEGLSRALRIYLGKEKAPKFVVKKDNPMTLIVEPEVAQVRPFAAGAVLRGVTFTPRRYESFIALQDKLHSNICRNRSLVAIGTHDLAKMKGTTVRYQGRKPENIKFRPLNQQKEMAGPELLEFYRNDRNLAKFVPLIDQSPVLPLFVDEADTVLSLPPLINSDHTKITLETKDIFFDLTATDETKLDIVLNQMVTMFAQYAEKPFEVEAVKVVYEDGRKATRLVPDLSSRSMSAEVNYLNSVLGFKQDASYYASLVPKMALEATAAGDEIDLLIPPTRADILHQCDIVEDVGIAYGFNNLKRTFPNKSATLGKLLPLNNVSDICRKESAMSGWVEVMPLTLCSIAENFDWLRRKDDGTAVHLENPKTVEYQVVRTTLYPGLLKTIRENRKHTLPIRVFEAGEVVFKDTSKERQASQSRHFAAVYAGKASGFEITQGLLDRLMKMLRYTPGRKGERKYWLEEADLPTFFPGRGANIFVRHTADGDARKIGTIGVFHPEVLANFELPFVCSGFEFDVKEFL